MIDASDLELGVLLANGLKNCLPPFVVQCHYFFNLRLERQPITLARFTPLRRVAVLSKNLYFCTHYGRTQQMGQHQTS
jgi:hypothetical protein